MFTDCPMLVVRMNALGAAGLWLLLAGGCAGLNPGASEEMARGAAASGTVTTAGSFSPPSAAVIESAVQNPRRRAADRDRDRLRKPADVLRFFGIRPGMTVLDLFSGGGYYTELLSFVVGDEGRVVAHNNTPYLNFSGKELNRRLAGDRLSNVERLIVENDDFSLPPNTFDAAVMILAYHDVYFVDKSMGWSRIDAPEMLAEIYRSLKPGGILGVIDHAAEPGAPPETGGTLHRIDPALLEADLTAAGFVLEERADILRSGTDDRSRPVFDDDLRGRTDRFVMRFRRP